MICRLCLRESDCCLKIFDFNGEQLGIADILKRHFWFQPLPDDYISTVICRICWLKVSDFHQFYLTVEQAHSLLCDTDVKHETVNIVVEAEFIEGSVQIKEECSEHLRQTDQVEEAVNPLDEPELEASEREESAKNCSQPESIKEESNSALENAEEIARNTRKTRQKREYVRKNPPLAKKVRKNVKKEDEDSEYENGDGGDEQEKPKRLKVIASTLQDDAMVKKHIAMGCEMCAFVGEDFASMTKHFRLQHSNTKPYIRCCDKKLNKRFKVVQHAYKHEDPDFFKYDICLQMMSYSELTNCKANCIFCINRIDISCTQTFSECQDCLKVFSDRYTLKSHRMAAHAPEEELNFACDQCPKKFSRKHLLELHRPSHIPRDERSFICDKCPNSRFASNYLLNIHVSMRHRRATNVCHVCAKEIRDKASFEKHVRLHFEESGPRVKCPRPDCDRWLKDEENLRHHMRRHDDEGLVFTCDECGRVCKNRRALRSHINYIHSNEVFTCEECNKTFKKAITLREHMAQHTGESLYKCPFCTRTFNSNANMHSHKKKMHPVEWDIWRKTKQGSSQQLISKQQSLI